MNGVELTKQSECVASVSMNISGKKAVGIQFGCLFANSCVIIQTANHLMWKNSNTVVGGGCGADALIVDLLPSTFFCFAK